MMTPANPIITQSIDTHIMASKYVAYAMQRLREIPTTFDLSQIYIYRYMLVLGDKVRCMCRRTCRIC